MEGRAPAGLSAQRALRALARVLRRTGVARVLVGRISVGARLAGMWRSLLKPADGIYQTPFGFSLYSDMNDTVSDQLTLHGVYEPGVTAVMRAVLRPGMTAIDVGAHVGYFTLLACSLVGPAGRVIAFEPERRNFALLDANIRRNDFRHALLYHQAVTNRPGQITMHVAQKSTHHTIVQAPSDPSAIAVEATSLDVTLAALGWPAVHLIKIDAEGAELFVLEGMGEVADRNPDLRLIVEFTPGNLERLGRSPENLLTWLRARGFRLSLIDDTYGRWRPWRDRDLGWIRSRRAAPYANLFCDRDPQ